MDTGAVDERAAPAPRGDEDYGELYRENLRPLLGMATALIGSRSQAEEVVQEAFATVFDRYGRLADPTRTLRRAVLKGCASRKPEPADPTPGTERILGRVRALSRTERDAVALRHSLGLAVADIDRTLGLEPGTAAARLADAGERLRATLEVGDDLDHALTTAFAETTAGLGHLLARPGDAQRRVYRRRRVRVGVAAAVVLVALVGLVVLLRPSPSEEVSAGGTDTSAAPRSSATTTAAGEGSTTEAATTTGAATSAVAPTAATYTVVANDGWYAIAKKVDVPVDSLLQANGATLSTPLHVGQVLQVPPKASPTT